MSRDYDPHAESTDVALLDQAMSMGERTCKTFDETYSTDKKFKQLVDEYKKVTGGDPLEERLKCWALWNMLDKHTLAQAGMRPEPKGNSRSFIAICNLSGEPHVEPLITQQQDCGLR